MKFGSILAGVALLLFAASAGAQMYKWKDAKGVVHFSDQPPPDRAIKVEKKSVDGGGARDAGLPYALAEAARRSPVVLYTTADCTACDQGRALLNQRGVPFTEKTVTSNEDQQKLKEAGSSGQLPLLLVGGAKRIGFEAGAWHETLTQAAYPAQRRLPAGYRNPAAAPAAPPPAPAEPPPPREIERIAPAPRPPSPGTPPGFKF